MTRYIDDELVRLLHDTESELCERKESFKGDVPKKARQAICAFCNDLSNHNKAGVLIIGAKDDGSPSHLMIDDALLLNIANMKTDGNILPVPTMSVEKRVLDGAEMVVVIVMPSDIPPVKYDGRIWVRTGPRRSLASAQDERILIEKRRYKHLPFDLYPVSTASLSDLVRSKFEYEYLPSAFASDVLEENGRSYEERLSSCKMIVSPEETVPTVTGILALGKTPQDFILGAFIQFLRIDGTELSDEVIDEEKITGALVEVLRRIEEKLKAHNRNAIDITSSPTHAITSPYPQVALQQLVYNAVMHRTYENTNMPIRVYWFNDRIEIMSPGGPYGNVTVNNFATPGITDYRNPNIADVLKVFGYVQSFGRGIATAKKALETNGNPPLDFEVNESHVLCIIRGKQ